MAAGRSDVGEQLGLLAQLSPGGWGWVGVACAFQLTSLAGRTLRWRFLFARPRPRAAKLFSALCVGYLANNLIARSGEVLRMWLVGRRTPGLGAFGVAVTIAAERLLDVVMVLTLAVVVLALADGGAVAVLADGGAFRALVAAAVAVSAAVVLAVRHVERIHALAEHVLGRLPARVAALAGPVARGAVAGLGTLRGSGAGGLGVVLGLCVLDWLWVMLCFRSAALAFGASLSTYEVCVLMVASGLGAMVPSGPGNVGTMVPLMQLAAEQTPLEHAALAYSATMYCVYWFVRSTTGLICLAVEAPDLREKDTIL